MLTQIGIKREFNRQYGNLVELHRRAFDCTKNYPRQLCAMWFMHGVQVIIDDASMRELLTDEKIDNINVMSRDFRRASFTSVEEKKVISELLKELEDVKSSLTGFSK
ncbi:MAG: hypothetical protein ACLRFE_04535 [Clostridia bacterium]